MYNSNVDLLVDGADSRLESTPGRRNRENSQPTIVFVSKHAQSLRERMRKPCTACRPSIPFAIEEDPCIACGVAQSLSSFVAGSAGI